MSTSPITIRRCQHIKVNGIQCGSPAMRDERFCFFHEQCRVMNREINMRFTEHGIIKLPTLEDANSIQLGLSEVMRLLVTHQIDHRIASLLLRALRTAAANVRFTSCEPKQSTQIVIDPKCVENRPLGATAWSTVEGRDYDLIGTNDETNRETNDQTNEGETREAKNSAATHQSKEAHEFEDHLRLTEGFKHDPKFLDRPETEVEVQSNSPLPGAEYREHRNRENWR
jgi:hypothetical protein